MNYLSINLFEPFYELLIVILHVYNRLVWRPVGPVLRRYAFREQNDHHPPGSSYISDTALF